MNPNERFEVYLGVDDAIKVESRQPKTFSSQDNGLFYKGFLSKVKSITKITNTSPSTVCLPPPLLHSLVVSILDLSSDYRFRALKQVKVCVRDQLPISKSTSIKVNLSKPDLSSNPHVKLNPNTNEIKWYLPIPPSGEVVVPFSFSISYPPSSLSLQQEL